MNTGRPDTLESPAARPRVKTGERNEIVAPSTLNGEPEEGKRRGRWTMEGTGAWAAVLIVLAGLFGSGAMWVESISKDASTLSAWKSEHEKADASLHDNYEHRLQSLETAQQVSAASSSGKVDTVISKLDDLSRRVGNIEHAMSVGEPYRVRQPRNRPTPARPRVDPP